MARALYIHWPFCERKCPYCDFNSHVRDQVDFAAWRRALVADMRHEAAMAAGKPLESIFFGGGTPSLMPPQLVGDLLAEAERLWGFAAHIEISLEANPSSVEADNFAALSSAGISRISLGVQSFTDESLHFLGRLHSASEAIKAIDIAQQNFDRVSFDLIYARPGQNEQEWRAELERALAIGTGHLSLYQLTIEPGTRFASDVRTGRFDPLDDDPAAVLFAATQDMTEAAGLPAYEISNHARMGQESRHNLTYWRYRDYCGIGTGAHGRWQGCASERHKKPENFLRACAEFGHGIKSERALGNPEQAIEALLVGLRLREGVDLAAFETRFGISAQGMVNFDKLALHRNLGLVWQDGTRIGLTGRGRPLLDSLLGELVIDGLVEA